MLKRYRSKSLVSLNVVLPTGGNTHISFNAKTGGGSMYATEDSDIQKGLENHPKFGKLFVVDNTELPKASAERKKTEQRVVDMSDKADKAKGGNVADGMTKVVEVKMACNDDAKDYLADKFGVSRSKMRSRADIEKVAETNNIKIIWE